jgi:hypothetical protein
MIEVAERRWDDEPGGLLVNVSGETETADNSDIMSWYRAACQDVLKDKSLTKEQRAGRKAALKVQRSLKMAARKSDLAMRKMRSMKKLKAAKPHT